MKKLFLLSMLGLLSYAPHASAGIISSKINDITTHDVATFAAGAASVFGYQEARTTHNVIVDEDLNELKSQTKNSASKFKEYLKYRHNEKMKLFNPRRIAKQSFCSAAYAAWAYFFVYNISTLLKYKHMA